MDMTIGIRAARERWAEITRRVGEGEAVVLTRHGTPVAQLEPLRDELLGHVRSKGLIRHIVASTYARAILADLVARVEDGHGWALIRRRDGSDLVMRTFST